MNLSLQSLDSPRKAGQIKKKRNTFEIISEMLGAVGQGSRETSIMYRANLSYTLLVQYLSLLRASRTVEPESKLET